MILSPLRPVFILQERSASPGLPSSREAAALALSGDSLLQQSILQDASRYGPEGRTWQRDTIVLGKDSALRQRRMKTTRSPLFQHLQETVGRLDGHSLRTMDDANPVAPK